MNDTLRGRQAHPAHTPSAKQTKQTKRTGSRASSKPRRAADFVQPVERQAYSVTEAMAALNLGRPALYKLLMSKRLVSIRVGGRRLIPADAITRFLDHEVEVQMGRDGDQYAL